MFFVFLLPGLGLVVFSIYTFVSVLLKQLTWTKTEGTISGSVIQSDSDGDYVYEKAVFTDASGKSIEVISKTSAGSTEANWKREGQVTIYYNPNNSSNADLFSWGQYLPIFFLPFGLLLMYLGWPHREMKRPSTST